MQFSVRLVGDDEERFDRLCASFAIGRYQLAKRLLMIGMARVEGGADLHNPDSHAGIERLFEELRTQLIEELRASRARDFNLALDNVETRAWLRTLGEILAPSSTAAVKTKVQNSRGHFLSGLEQIPVDAPQHRTWEGD